MRAAAIDVNILEKPLVYKTRPEGIYIIFVCILYMRLEGREGGGR